MSSGWLSATGSPPARADHLGAVDQALGPQEADRELGLVAGRPHRDGDRDRLLARTGGPDLERRLADDPVVADLERLAADGHDPAAGDVPGRRWWPAAGGRRAWPHHRRRADARPGPVGAAARVPGRTRAGPCWRRSRRTAGRGSSRSASSLDPDAARSSTRRSTRSRRPWPTIRARWLGSGTSLARPAGDRSSSTAGTRTGPPRLAPLPDVALVAPDRAAERRRPSRPCARVPAVRATTSSRGRSSGSPSSGRSSWGALGGPSSAGRDPAGASGGTDRGADAQAVERDASTIARAGGACWRAMPDVPPPGLVSRWRGATRRPGGAARASATGRGRPRRPSGAGSASSSSPGGSRRR